MNETLEKIMIFINENTNILIGICLFLIFVLVAYLIDNSIKSKKVMKKMKEDKNELLESESETIPVMPINYSLNNETDIQNQQFEEAIENNNINLEIKDEPIYSDVFNEAADSNKNNEDISNDITSVITTLNRETENIVNQETKADVIYKNDKKLSDILFGELSNEPPKDDLSKITSNIFDDSKNRISDKIPEDVESKVEIELNETELDNIMKKLNNGNSINDDNYTNIF